MACQRAIFFRALFFAAVITPRRSPSPSSPPIRAVARHTIEPASRHWEPPPSSSAATLPLKARHAAATSRRLAAASYNIRPRFTTHTTAAFFSLQDITTMHGQLSSYSHHRCCHFSLNMDMRVWLRIDRRQDAPRRLRRQVAVGNFHWKTGWSRPGYFAAAPFSRRLPATPAFIIFTHRQGFACLDCLFSALVAVTGCH